MSLIAKAKAKAANGSVKEAFRNEDGAIDLASIMVGIIVIGLIGGVIAATVFAVIPWAQDNAAKQQLDSVAAAQSAFIGLTTDGAVYYAGSSAAGEAGLVANNNIITPDGDDLFDGTSNTDLFIGAVGSGNEAAYAASIKSASGAVYYITDGNTQPTQATLAAAAPNQTLVSADGGADQVNLVVNSAQPTVGDLVVVNA